VNRARKLAGIVTRLLPVHDASQVGEARRATAAVAQEAELEEELIGRLSIVATEAATNLARHAKDGVLLVRCLVTGRGVGMEVIAVDRGPGIADIGRALEDGFSTGGTMGSGMGAIRRQADEFDVYSQPGAGTVLVARLWARGATVRPAATEDLAAGVVCLPHPAEQACGDGWCVTRQDSRSSLLVVDGLGHGPSAAEAAEIAIGVFRERRDAPAGMIEALHRALRGTRGAALAVAEVDAAAGRVHFAGVGNISAMLFSPGAKMSSMPSHSGIVGHQMRKVQEFAYDWTPSSTLVMHSDGLATRWRMEQYPGLLGRDPSLLAAILHRDHTRGRDDVTVMVLGAAPRPSS
jgi:anti-sigma regulatory factor (Ser/Thr protein kinase)